MKKPCKECPFNKRVNLKINDLGGSTPETYIGQINYPFWLPCHLDKKYDGTSNNIGEIKLCTGASMFRHNIGYKFPEKENFIEVLESNDDVFESYKDFYQHYKECSEEEAEQNTTEYKIKEYTIQEIIRAYNKK